jgi:phosphatidylinositol alpha-1,6-mannosyltransferase
VAFDFAASHRRMSNPQLRCLVITELFLPTKGGTAVWFDEVYRRLAGSSIHIVTAEVPGAAAHDRNHPNTVHRLTLRRYRWLRPESLAMYAKLAAVSLAIGLRHEFDSVHAGRILPEGLVGWIVARVLWRPFIVYSLGEELTTWRQPAKLRVMRWAYRRADVVIANSEFTHDKLIGLGVPAERITILYPGVDIDRLRPGLRSDDLTASLGIGAQQKLVVSVGRLSRRKGFDQVIRTLPLLVARGLDVHYAVIGIGEDRDYLCRLAEELGVSTRVHLLGHVEPEDLPRWYNAADVVTMPNREIDGDTEGFGMVFIEAAACGKPTVAGVAGGTAAAVIDEVTGLRIDGSSTQAVSTALARLLEDPSFAHTLGANGYRRAVSQFAWKSVAQRTRAILQMQRAGRPGRG